MHRVLLATYLAWQRACLCGSTDTELPGQRPFSLVGSQLKSSTFIGPARSEKLISSHILETSTAVPLAFVSDEMDAEARGQDRRHDDEHYDKQIQQDALEEDGAETKERFLNEANVRKEEALLREKEVHLKERLDKAEQTLAELQGKEPDESEKGEEGKPTRIDYAVSLLLLGCVTFVMFLFILANIQDTDMRLYVWRVISQTISIFCAVLGFTSVYLLVHERLLHESAARIHLVADFILYILYTLWMQVAIASYSGAFKFTSLPEDCGDTDQSHRMRRDSEASKLEKAVGTKCWATLLAHVNGFAAIALGGAIQHRHPFAETPALSLLVVPIMTVGLWIVNALCRIARSRIGRLHAESGWDHHGKTLWEQEAYNCEIDVAALCLSYLAFQSLLYSVTSALPDDMGFQAGRDLYPATDAFMFLGFTLCFMLVTVAMVITVTKLFPVLLHSSDMDALSQDFSFKLMFGFFWKRMILVYTRASGMCVAWCFMYWLQLSFVRVYPSLGSPTGIEFRLVLALGVSGIAFVVILLLDKIADATCVEDVDLENMVDETIFNIISALCISVGFSWEQAFEKGVEVVSDRMPLAFGLKDRSVSRLILAMAIIGLVTYAWREYILAKLHRLEEIQEEKLSRRLEELEELQEAKVSKDEEPISIERTLAETACTSVGLVYPRDSARVMHI